MSPGLYLHVFQNNSRVTYNVPAQVQYIVYVRTTEADSQPVAYSFPDPAMLVRIDSMLQMRQPSCEHIAQSLLNNERETMYPVYIVT